MTKLNRSFEEQGQIEQEALLQQLRAEYAALSMKLHHHPPVPQAIRQQLLKILLDAHSSATAAFEAYRQSLIRREEQYLRIINSRLALKCTPLLMLAWAD